MPVNVPNKCKKYLHFACHSELMRNICVFAISDFNVISSSKRQRRRCKRHLTPISYLKLTTCPLGAFTRTHTYTSGRQGQSNSIFPPLCSASFPPQMVLDDAFTLVGRNGAHFQGVGTYLSFSGGIDPFPFENSTICWDPPLQHACAIIGFSLPSLITRHHHWVGMTMLLGCRSSMYYNTVETTFDYETSFISYLSSCVAHTARSTWLLGIFFEYQIAPFWHPWFIRWWQRGGN